MFISGFMPRPKGRSFGADTAGTAGIEFALIVPIAMVLLLAAVEYSRAVVMSRRFNLVTATLSDLIARDDYEDSNTMIGLQKAVETIWSPYDKSSLVMQVVVVRQAMAGATKITPLSNYVAWSYQLPIDSTAQQLPAYNNCSAYSGLPTGMLSPAASTVIVNSKYTFKTLFGAKVPGFTSSTSTWTSSSSHSPRNLCVYWGSGGNCVSTCEN